MITYTIAAMAIAASCGCSAHHSSVAVNSDPNAAWVHQKAIECQGDMSKLSSDDQQKLKSLYGFPSAPSMIANDYYKSKGGQ